MLKTSRIQICKENRPRTNTFCCTHNNFMYKENAFFYTSCFLKGDLFHISNLLVGLFTNLPSKYTKIRLNPNPNI
jgi:hypothetical protein